ncbi:hypothetical protein MVEN_02391200 [Mycena venus]|uniref:Uncharacterized protein n=1 Tax=Mycena venus TaxID=2733690 RepID=A0A8H7CEB1_9AGAR|nr:hypothetical protein MVEN_02391200 [Mycena venus]
MDDGCFGICCCCVTCFGLVAAAVRYIPFQSVCKCRRWKTDEDDEDEAMKFPEQQAQFTPDGQRIQRDPYTAPMQMQVVRSSQDPDVPPPIGEPNPPGYTTAVRDGIRSDGEQPLQPLGHRPEHPER